MAELQSHTEAGEMTQIFVEFVMMQAQNAALCLGQMTDPRAGEPQINLPLAKMFIDQLAVIRARTAGNLSPEEQRVIDSTLEQLRLAFVQVAAQTGNFEAGDMLASVPSDPKPPAGTPAPPTRPPATTATAAPAAEAPPASAAPSPGSKAPSSAGRRAQAFHQELRTLSRTCRVRRFPWAIAGSAAPTHFTSSAPASSSREEFVWRMARQLKAHAPPGGVQFVFKACYDKANRTSVKSFRGTGVAGGMPHPGQHRPGTGRAGDHRCAFARRKPRSRRNIIDILQIPAFLCRQTDLIQAAAETGRVVNVKKGQFLAPWDVRNIADKLVGLRQ